MNVKTAKEWFQDLPEDFELCFSEQTAVVMNENGEDIEYVVVLDKPIIGMLMNDDTKEVRFFCEIKEDYLNKQIEAGKKWRKI